MAIAIFKMSSKIRCYGTLIHTIVTMILLSCKTRKSITCHFTNHTKSHQTWVQRVSCHLKNMVLLMATQRRVGCILPENVNCVIECFIKFNSPQFPQASSPTQRRIERWPTLTADKLQKLSRSSSPSLGRPIASEPGKHHQSINIWKTLTARKLQRLSRSYSPSSSPPIASEPGKHHAFYFSWIYWSDAFSPILLLFLTHEKQEYSLTASFIIFWTITIMVIIGV